MEKKGLLKNLIQESKKGNIREVLQIINSNGIILQENYALNIVVDCSGKCMDNPEHVVVQDVTDLLNIAVKSISNPKESYSLAYLQSVFHILKFYISQEHYSHIFQIESVISPRFLQKTLPNTHVDVYCAIVNQFINMISNLKIKKSREVVEIITNTTKIVVCFADAREIFDLVYTSVFKMNCLKIDAKTQSEYYFNILQMIKSKKEKLSYAQKDCYSFLSSFPYIWNNILKTNRFGDFRNFYEQSFVFFKDVKPVLILLKSLGYVFNFVPEKYRPKGEYSLETLKEVIKQDSALKSRFTGIFNCLFYSLVYYYKNNESIWVSFNENRQILLFESIKNLFEITLEWNSCSCTTKTIQDCFENQRLFDYIYNLSKIQLKSGKASTDFCDKLRKLFKSLYEFAKHTISVDCKNRQQVWKSLGIHVYNLGITLYKAGNTECIEYFCVFARYALKSNTGKEDKMLTASLNSICDKLFKERNYIKCMVLTAFLILVLGDNQAGTTAFKLWWLMSKVKLKEISKNEDDQHLTLVSALQKFKHFTDPIADTSKYLTTSARVELLTLELEMYKAKWFSREPVLAAFKELSSVADLLTVVKVAVDIFGDSQHHIHPEALKIVVKTLKTYEETVREPNDIEKYNLGVLYHLKYTYVVSNVIEKHCDEMEKSLMIIAENSESSEPPDALPKDQNEECNIVSSYENLKLDKFLVNLKILNKSLEMFECTNFEKLNDKNLDILSKLLMKIGLEYRMQRIDTHSFKILKLALKLAEIKNNSLDTLASINFLIENDNITEELQQQLITQGDKIVTTLEHSTENLKIILTFLINKCKILFYIDHKKSFEILEEAQILYEKEQGNDKFLSIKGKLLYMQHKFLNELRCDLQIEHHQSTSLLKLFEAHTVLYKAFDTSDVLDKQMVIDLFEINEEIVKLHYNLRLVKEIRYYGRAIVLFAQKLLVPLRTVMFLSYLAYADLISCKFESCKLGLEGIEDILCLRKFSYAHPSSNDEIVEQKGAGDVEKITNMVEEMVLDLPTSYKKQCSYSSPALTIESFKMPSFFNHPEDCLCFFCTNVEYHKYLLFKTKLDALYHDYQKNPNIADDFFKGALLLYETLIKIYDNNKNSDNIVEISCEILLEYANHLKRNFEKDEALKVNCRLLNLLKNKEDVYSYVYRQALFQNICLNFTFETPSNNKEDSVEIIESSQISLTPDNKCSSVLVPFTDSCKISPPKRRIKKPKKFNLSPDETEEKPSISKQQIFGGNLLPNKMNFSTLPPNSLHLQSSIDATEPKTRKKTIKSTNSSKENDYGSPESPKNKIRIFSGSEIKRKVKSTKKNPTIYGTNFVLPSASKTENKAASASRTMSLTERLNKQEEAKAKIEKKSVRKNLMKEMGDDSGSSVTVRRSARKIN